MSWSIGYDSKWNRDIGYGVPAYCDHPDCNEEIDRGLAYVCGSEPYGGDNGCGLYFCSKHLFPNSKINFRYQCERCRSRKLLPAFNPKQEHPEWTQFKMTDESWSEWRKENKLETVQV